MWMVPDSLNVVDRTNMPQIAALIKRCQESVAVSLTQAHELCADIMGYMEMVSGAVDDTFDEAGVFPYDARIFAYDWDPTE